MSEDDDCNGGLMLTRKEGEVVIIRVGDIKIKVTLTKIYGSQVRLRFGAPRDKVSIHREEKEERYGRTE
jgi:carbon storage regulator CsrA